MLHCSYACSSANGVKLEKFRIQWCWKFAAICPQTYTAHSIVSLLFTCIALCLMMRQNDSNIECERNGKFKQLQCHPVPGNTTSGTPGPRSSPKGRSKGKKSTRADEDSICRCVDPINGTTIEGTEERVMARERKPDCDRRGTWTSLAHRLLLDNAKKLKLKNKEWGRLASYPGHTAWVWG